MQKVSSLAHSSPPPHAAPTPAGAARAAGRVPPVLKALYIGAFGVAVAAPGLSTLAVYVTHEARAYEAWRAARALFPLASLLGGLCWIGMLVLALVWLHAAWSALPQPERRTRSGREVTPSAAVGLLFVPFFNVYWAFVVALGLCDAIDRRLEGAGSYTRAPRGLAVGALLAPLLPFVGVFSPVLWFFYMCGVERAQAEALP
jgi:hypothetical protein